MERHDDNALRAVADDLVDDGGLLLLRGIANAQQHAAAEFTRLLADGKNEAGAEGVAGAGHDHADEHRLARGGRVLVFGERDERAVSLHAPDQPFLGKQRKRVLDCDDAGGKAGGQFAFARQLFAVLINAGFNFLTQRLKDFFVLRRVLHDASFLFDGVPRPRGAWQTTRAQDIAS